MRQHLLAFKNPHLASPNGGGTSFPSLWEGLGEGSS